MAMNTRIYFLSMMLIALCMVACGTHTDPETEDPKTGTDPETETHKKEVLTVTPLQINAPAEGGGYMLEIESQIKWQVSTNAGWVTCNPGVGKNNGRVIVIVSESEVAEVTNATITVSEYGSGATDNKVLVSVTRAAGSEKSESPEQGGALSGLFSVSESVKVRFSKGNLQYQASTKIWRLASNQYDMIGADNQNISSTYAGWIDLFGWGTGNKPTNTSTDYSDYSTFVDWGVNVISNGGNKANQWRTLTYDEWSYLFNTRTNASTLRGQATVNGVTGYVFLADGFVLPTGLSFIANPNDWTTNNYTAAEWSQMETVGAVFLPAAGYRYGTEVSDVGSSGSYWSSSPYDESGADGMDFSSDFAFPGGHNRDNGQSVRLVQEL